MGLRPLEGVARGATGDGLRLRLWGRGCQTAEVARRSGPI